MSDPMGPPAEADSLQSYAERLRLLVEAGLFVSRELHLDEVLDRIVQTAATVIGARYAALGVIDEDGSGLSNFVVSGLSKFDKERIGALPVGRGLLGALITDPRPIRLAKLQNDSRSVPFPPNHPPMTSFLGVPIHARGKVFGNLYLTEKEGAVGFSEEDERLAVVLAGQAGVAIENARLYEDSQRSESAAKRRQHALEMVQEVGAAVVAELDPTRVLRLIAQRARGLVGADGAVIALKDDIGDDFVIRVAAGGRAGALEGMKFAHEGSVSGIVLETLEAMLVDDAEQDPRVSQPASEVAGSRSGVVAPLIAEGEAVGVLTVFDGAPGKFDTDDLFVVKSFADLASIALQNSRAIAAERERSELEAELAEARLREGLRTLTLQAVIRAQEDERRRLSRELHDSFGQALTSILLGLKVIEQQETPEAARASIAGLRDITAAAATEIRRIASELRPVLLDDLGLEAALERYVSDVFDRTGIRIDAALSIGSQRLHPDVETVIYRIAQEAIMNAIKYAEPTRITLSLSATGGSISLAVTDDGTGFDVDAAHGKGLGLLGMRERAELVGAKLNVRSEIGAGTSVEVDVPREPALAE